MLISLPFGSGLDSIKLDLTSIAGPSSGFVLAKARTSIGSSFRVVTDDEMIHTTRFLLSNVIDFVYLQCLLQLRLETAMQQWVETAVKTRHG